MSLVLCTCSLYTYTCALGNQAWAWQARWPVKDQELLSDSSVAGYDPACLGSVRVVGEICGVKYFQVRNTNLENCFKGSFSTKHWVKLIFALKISVLMRKVFCLNHVISEIRWIGGFGDVLGNKSPKAILDLLFLLILLYMKSDQLSMYVYNFTVNSKHCILFV